MSFDGITPYNPKKRTLVGAQIDTTERAILPEVYSDLLLLIFSKLKTTDFLNTWRSIPLVCRSWNKLFDTPNFWMTISKEIGFESLRCSHLASLQRAALQLGTMIGENKDIKVKSERIKIDFEFDDHSHLFLNNQFVLFYKHKTLNFFSIFEKRTLKAHRFTTDIIRVCHFDNFLYCALRCGKIVVLNIDKNFKFELSFEPKVSSIEKLLINKNYLIALFDGKLDIWNRHTLEHIRIHQISTSHIYKYYENIEHLQLDGDTVYWTSFTLDALYLYCFDLVNFTELCIGKLHHTVNALKIQGRECVCLFAEHSNPGSSEDNPGPKIETFEIVRNKYQRNIVKKVSANIDTTDSAFDIVCFGGLAALTCYSLSDDPLGRNIEDYSIKIIDIHRNRILFSIQDVYLEGCINFFENSIQYLTSTEYVKHTFPSPIAKELVSDIQLLPDDLILMIFQTAIPDNFVHSFCTLSLSCKRWKVILNNPCHWSLPFKHLGFTTLNLEQLAITRKMAIESGSVLNNLHEVPYESVLLPNELKDRKISFLKNTHLVSYSQNKLLIFDIKSSKSITQFDFSFDIVGFCITDNKIYCYLNDGSISMISAEEKTVIRHRVISIPRNRVYKLIAKDNVLVILLETRFEIWDCQTFIKLRSVPIPINFPFDEPFDYLQIDGNLLYLSGYNLNKRTIYCYNFINNKLLSVGEINPHTNSLRIAGHKGAYISQKLIPFTDLEEHQFNDINYIINIFHIDDFMKMRSSSVIEMGSMGLGPFFMQYSNDVIILMKNFLLPDGTDNVFEMDYNSIIDFIEPTSGEKLLSLQNHMISGLFNISGNTLQYITIDNKLIEYTFPTPIIKGKHLGADRLNKRQKFDHPALNGFF